MIGDSFQHGRHLRDGYHETQIAGCGLAQRDDVDALAIDLDFELVDLIVVIEHLALDFAVALAERVHGGREGLLSLLALLFWWRRRSEGMEQEPVRPQLAPFDELLAELDRIAAEPSALRLHTRLSLALRAYLGRSLDFPAAESTTSEVNRRLLATSEDDPIVPQLLSRWAKLHGVRTLLGFAAAFCFALPYITR